MEELHKKIKLSTTEKKKEVKNMSKYKVVRYFDTYPEDTIAEGLSKEDAEKLATEKNDPRKPKTKHYARKED